MSTHPATLRAFFEPAPIDHPRLTRALRQRVGGAARAVGRARDEVALVLEEPVLNGLRAALDINFAEIMARAWTSLAEIRDAAQLSATGRAYAVPLGRHRLRSEHAPSLEIAHENVVVGSLGAQATLDLSIEQMEIILQDGAITAIRRGDYFGAGALAIGGAQIATLERRPFSLQGEARLRHPLKLPV